MALHNVPVTMRNFFWDDPFFSNAWDDFDRMRNDIWKERSFNRFDLMRSDSQDYFPRRWLMPKGFFDDENSKIIMPQLKDEVLRVKEDKDKFEVSLDTNGFKPEELQIKIKDDLVTVEARHEEKIEEKNYKSFGSRHFSRSFTLPKGCKAENVTSNLSADGLLMVSAPKVEAIKDERKVPIQMKP